MSTIASQITSLTIAYSTVYSDADQRKPQSSASLAFVRGIHRGPVNSPHKWPVTWKMFPFDDVIMQKPRSQSMREGVTFITFPPIASYHAPLCEWWLTQNQWIMMTMPEELLRFSWDVIKWKHFRHYWPCLREIHWSPVNSPHRG